MKLTDKALKDFGIWLENQDVAPYKVIFPDIPVIAQNSYIIDWFDSVGIYVEINYREDFKYSFICFLKYKGDVMSTISGFKTLQEATNKAIEKANEIYNKL